MGALSEIYVDPAIAGNSGTGTIGDPYGDLQHALNTATRDATNGNRFNIKAGTDEILASALSFATYGTPTTTAPLILQGYTSAAGDGGIGGISGNNSVAVYAGAVNYVSWIDLHMHNCGAATILKVRYGFICNCEFNNTTGSGLLAAGSPGCFISNNYFHDIGTYGIDDSGDPVRIIGNYFLDETKKFSRVMNITSARAFISHNIISLNNASGNGIVCSYATVRNNSLFNAAAGTANGIWIASAGDDPIIIENNLVEGWSGAGGDGLQIDAGVDVGIYRNNAFYNCTTTVNNASNLSNAADNETLGATPFAKSGANTFANRAVYFAPVDTGNVQGGAYPTALRLDKGACQHADPAGGGGRPEFRGSNL